MGYSDGSLKILDLKAGAITKSMPSSESGTISDIAAHHDNNLILAGMNGKAVVASTNQGKVSSNTYYPINEENQIIDVI